MPVDDAAAMYLRLLSRIELQHQAYLAFAALAHQARIVCNGVWQGYERGVHGGAGQGANAYSGASQMAAGDHATSGHTSGMNAAIPTKAM